ncbi:Blp family class II bacteriocin [Limosilactobacillus reuteri]|uniref:Blp family class II bacteriocin n=1 Tax=Limosilactobacillus reuteri TaxID=1598 RepID=UPI001C5BF660|nr:Blp family class II bacteriocin [Limosilactobacillus reuteri]MBW3351350.1 Blp family class II bacteriocin [Limosilactobacillus reuteri]UUW69724.1 Blp family class II bacteriocin [Limosilactobacillus reuteri]
MEFTTLSTTEMLEITGGWSRRDTKCVLGAGGTALVGAASGNPFVFAGSAASGYASFCL